MNSQTIALNPETANFQPTVNGYKKKAAVASAIISRRANPFVTLAKAVSLSLLLCVAVAVPSTPVAAQAPAGQLQGHYTTIPLQGNTPEQALQESLAGTTLPMWTTTVQTKNWWFGQTNYKIQSLGGAYSGNTTTDLPTILIPIVLNFIDSSGQYIVATFDPTQPAPACAGGVTPVTAVQQSPLFNNSGPFMWGSPKVNFGTTQYVDALGRAEWYPSDATDGNWHTLFQLSSTVLTVTINVPYGAWQLYSAPCGRLGAVYNPSLDSTVRGLISALSNYGVNSTTLPVVLLSNVVSYNLDKSNNIECCTLGYHSAYGSPLQVYAEAMFDGTGAFPNSADITPLSHELAESVNDPTITNWAPQWGHIGQVTGCQGNLEVGDPLSGTQYPVITLSGFAYHPQELAMMTWFYGINSGLGWYSNNGTFKSPAAACFTFNPWIQFTNPVPID
jgi:hypothetical protein